MKGLSLPQKIMLVGVLVVSVIFMGVYMFWPVVGFVNLRRVQEEQSLIGTWRTEHADGADVIVFMQGNSGFVFSERHEWGDEILETNFIWTAADDVLGIMYYDPQHFATFGTHRSRTTRFEIVGEFRGLANCLPGRRVGTYQA